MLIRSLAVTLFVANAFADQHTLQFQTADSPQSFQQAATVIRSITEVPQAAVNAELKSLTVLGNADQIDAAAWIFKQ